LIIAVWIVGKVSRQNGNVCDDTSKIRGLFRSAPERDPGGRTSRGIDRVGTLRDGLQTIGVNESQRIGVRVCVRIQSAI